MPWKASAICLAIGTVAIAVSTQLLQSPDTEFYGVLFGAVGVGFVAASQFLQEHGYKAMFKHQ
jgi:hypothetical protein